MVRKIRKVIWNEHENRDFTCSAFPLLNNEDGYIRTQGFLFIKSFIKSFTLLLYTKILKIMHQPDKSNFLVYHSELQVINLSKKKSKQLFSILVGFSVYQHILSSVRLLMRLSYVIWSKYILKFSVKDLTLRLLNKSHAITSSHQECTKILVKQVPVYLSWLTITYAVLMLLFKIMYAFQILKALKF